MPTYERCTGDVPKLAKELLNAYPTYKPVLDYKVRIDFAWARADRDETNDQPRNNAISVRGVKALGVTRLIGSKDRVMGRGDVEITLDADWWDDASHEEQLAVLDHELYHIVVKGEKDSYGRPKLSLRKHDYEFGWFKEIAMRHGTASQERQQAQTLMEESKAILWPTLSQLKEEQKARSRVRNLELSE